ncbi:MAG: hypothetical protein KDK30_12980 [Leptospiraceae bacterium]|nr:hypothetical protein [Leptospiraceae bacterium]
MQNNRHQFNQHKNSPSRQALYAIFIFTLPTMVLWTHAIGCDSENDQGETQSAPQLPGLFKIQGPNIIIPTQNCIGDICPYVSRLEGAYFILPTRSDQKNTLPKEQSGHIEGFIYFLSDDILIDGKIQNLDNIPELRTKLFHIYAHPVGEKSGCYDRWNRDTGEYDETCVSALPVYHLESAESP